MEKLKLIVIDLIEYSKDNEVNHDNVQDILKKRMKNITKKSKLLYVYRELVKNKEIKPNNTIEKSLTKKLNKQMDGVITVTVSLPPFYEFFDKKSGKNEEKRFSCEYDCYYCPNPKGGVRSYPHDSPSQLRARRNGYDAILQFCDRLKVLENNGHPLDKIELIVLGGTWSSFEMDFRREFMRDLYYVANTYYSAMSGDPLPEKRFKK